MAWMTLILAGLFETGFAFCLGKARTAEGAAAASWYAGFAACLVLSMSLLMVSTKTLPIGTAYAAWTGIGAFGTVLVGILVFGEPAGIWRVAFLCGLVVCLAGLKIVS